MKITLEIPDRTVAAVITLLADERTKYDMITKTLDSGMIKDGAEFNLVPGKQQKESDPE